MNIEYIFSSYIIAACKLQNLWQMGKEIRSASGLPLFTLRRLHQYGFLKNRTKKNRIFFVNALSLLQLYRLLFIQLLF